MAGRWAVTLRATTVLAVILGVAFTAAGPTTFTGLLPYFTIQSNVLYGAVALVAIFRPVRPLIKGAATLYVAITGLVFHLVLDNPASPFWTGEIHRGPLDAIGNQLLHTVVPLLAVADLLLFDERRRLRWRYAVYWLAYPFGYLGFALLRGLVVHNYPYGFVDAGAIGYGGVAKSAVGLGVGFWLLGLALCGLDRVPLRRRPKVDQTV
jgi:hypothetical protein